MKFNRQTALRQYAQAKAAAANPALPDHIRKGFAQSAAHNQAALGLADALDRKLANDPGALPPEMSQEPEQPGLLSDRRTPTAT